MMPPRWFYVVLAACCAVLTLTVSAVLIERRDIGRWVTAAEPNESTAQLRTLDSKSGAVCFLSTAGASCFSATQGRMETQPVKH